MMDSRKISLLRAEELERDALPYEAAKKEIVRGNSPVFKDRYMAQKERVLRFLGATEDDWDDWRWQLRNRIEDEELLGEVLGLTDGEKRSIARVAEHYRWAITPYYLALIDPQNPQDPIKRMAVPQALELDLDELGCEDPMDEEHTNPAGTITRRYPDRLIINVTNSCAMFCRHCQRRRRIGECDQDAGALLLNESIEYIRAHTELRDILITGGDPLTLRSGYLDDLLSRVREIPHVEIIRLGTRTPVTMPQRITPGLIDILKQHQPIFLNTQFNHPQEMTYESIGALKRLADAGVPVGNQMVLLEGVNNDKYVVRLLNQELLKARARPYYIFHAKQVIGTTHFRTSVDDGIEIMEHLRGHTSGMAIPTYIINAPGGLGKIPILPQYIQHMDDDTVTLRTWEGKIVQFPNKPKHPADNA